MISCRELSLGYGGRAVADGISFDLEDGGFICVVGENGSGKSSLMRTLLGIQPPLSGSITLDGGLSRNEIGYLPQQSAAPRDIPATVREVVMSGFEGRRGMRPFWTKAERERALHCMERMGVADISGKPFRELSGGTAQRVLLARALVAATRALMLDEPVSGLDPESAAAMYTTIKELNDDGMAIMMISHDVAEALRLARSVLRLGRERYFGTAGGYIARFGGGEA